MAERAREGGRDRPQADRSETKRARRPGGRRPRRANTTDPHSRIIAQAGKGVLQGYNAQAAATTGHIVVAAEITNTTNDQPHFVPMATAVIENLVEAGHHGGAGTLVADAGYWSAPTAATDVGAEVLIATRKSHGAKPISPTMTSSQCWQG